MPTCSSKRRPKDLNLLARDLLARHLLARAIVEESIGEHLDGTSFLGARQTRRR